MESVIWTEKYRPKEFSDIKGQDEVVKRIEGFVRQKNMPHLLFAGPAGVGKTSLAILIAKKLFSDSWRTNLLELNASDERGIDVVRGKVKEFARTMAIGDVPFKIIYLDESDALTKEAQHALRRTMENFTRTCRFILSANYSSKIIDPIQSRCAIFRFKPLPREALSEIIGSIAEGEGLRIDEPARDALIELCGGDARKLENIMQSCAASSKTITEELVYSTASAAQPKEIQDLLKTALSGNFLKARERVIDIMYKFGLSGLDMIRQIQREIINLDIAPRGKMHLIDRCGEAEFRMTEGADEFIQIEALLSQFVLAGIKS